MKKIIKEEEDNKPDEEEEKKKKQEEEEDEEEDETMKTISKKIDNLTDVMNKHIDTHKQKEEDEEEEEKKKKQEEDEEEKKKQEEEDEEEKKKEIDPSKPDAPDKKEEGEPSPGDGEKKLPQAPAGETNEDAKEETDEVQILEKAKTELIKSVGPEITKKVEDVFKTLGITKTSSKRPNTEARSPQDIFKKSNSKKGELDGTDILKAGRKEGVKIADINKMARETMNEDRDEALKEALAANRGEA